jgi:hypothetical protein
MKIEDIVSNRALSQNRIYDKKFFSFKHENTNTRIFDSVLFSGFQ